MMKYFICIVTAIFLVLISGCDRIAEFTGEEDYKDNRTERRVEETNLYITMYTSGFPYDVVAVTTDKLSLDFSGYQNITEIKGIERLDQLQHFNARSNLLEELPEGVITQDLITLDVSNNRLTTLPFFNKRSSIEYFDISNNPLAMGKGSFRYFYMPAGSTLNIQNTDILCKEVCAFVRKNPEVTVISDCDCSK